MLRASAAGSLLPRPPHGRPPNRGAKAEPGGAGGQRPLLRLPLLKKRVAPLCPPLKITPNALPEPSAPPPVPLSGGVRGSRTGRPLDVAFPRGRAPGDWRALDPWPRRPGGGGVKQSPAAAPLCGPQPPAPPAAAPCPAPTGRAGLRASDGQTKGPGGKSPLPPCPGLCLHPHRPRPRGNSCGLFPNLSLLVLFFSPLSAR